MNLPLSTKKCLICNKGKKNDTLYWHCDPDTADIWCWCSKCSRGYSLQQYCTLAGLSLKQFLTLDFDFQEARNNEVTKMDWPRHFLPLADPKSKPAIEYLAARGIDPEDGMYYDTNRKGIVFPYYMEQHFVGAQIRLIEPWIDEEGTVRKIDTMPGTRLGLLFYNWNQSKFMTDIHGVIITEGAFNAIAIQQSLNRAYGGYMKNPWKCMAASGSGASAHQVEMAKELKEAGIKVVLAPDSDEAGMKMMKKFIASDAITHYALTGDDKIDWNDAAKAMGKADFAKWLIGSIKHVQSSTGSTRQD